MICERCGKKREKTFRRVGGSKTYPDSDVAVEIPGFSSMCAPCIKTGFRSGRFTFGPIITNPTIKPSGDPLEWVINE